MADATAALVVEGLGVSFPPRRVLDGVSFALPQGAFCGLIGFEAVWDFERRWAR